MATVAGFGCVPLIGATAIAATATQVSGAKGGNFQLPNIAPPTWGRPQPVGREPLDLSVQDVGIFSIPPANLFTDALGTPMMGGLVTGTAASALPIWGGAMFTVINPSIQKGCLILLTPDTESSPAAYNSFNASYAGWNNLFAFPSVLGTQGTVKALAAAVAGGGAVTDVNMCNFGQVAMQQVDNGSFTLFCAAGPEWPCFGMRVGYIIINPMKDVVESGVNTQFYCTTNLNAVAASVAQEADPAFFRV